MPAIKQDLYELVTNRVVAALEGGAPPWAAPWRGGNGRMRPANAATGRAYRGINILLLNMQAAAAGYPSSEWLTFNQAKSLGAHVRRGEEGAPVVFFKMQEKLPALVDDPTRSAYPLLKRFTVFNVAQVDNLPPEFGALGTDPLWDSCAQAEDLIQASGACLHFGGHQAFYAPESDLIRLPEKALFTSTEAYYDVALHELTHWTGHKSRLDRPLGGRFGLNAYAFEELIAEMGSAFLNAHCGLDSHLQHAAYVQEWLKALKNDKRLIFRAAS
ncbi:MAG: DUF1738 domain-containing protein, partial [Myxococcaceae bacterium]